VRAQVYKLARFGGGIVNTIVLLSWRKEFGFARCPEVLPLILRSYLALVEARPLICSFHRICGYYLQWQTFSWVPSHLKRKNAVSSSKRPAIK
jgi:hypothetical protein